MTRVSMVAFLTLVLLVAPLAAEVQPPGKIPRIGILRPGSPPDPLIEAFRQGLRELGYAEGRDVTIEYRWTEGRDERLPDLAADLAPLKVDIIVTFGLGTQAAKRATSTIPIVLQVSIDPVADGLVASLARPGGNITGLATSTEDVPGKWMELLKDILPGVSRVAVLFDPTSSPAAQLKASEAAARSLGVRIQTLKVGRSDELGPAFAAAQKNRAEGLIIFGSAFVFAHRTRLVELAAIHRLPTIFDQRQFVVSSGGLMGGGRPAPSPTGWRGCRPSAGRPGGGRSMRRRPWVGDEPVLRQNYARFGCRRPMLSQQSRKLGRLQLGVIGPPRKSEHHEL